MSANRPRLATTADWAATTVSGQAPLRRYPTPARGQRAGLLLRLRALMLRLHGERPSRPGGPPPGRGPGDPPQRSEREAHWDDPALWMLMLH